MSARRVWRRDSRRQSQGSDGGVYYGNEDMGAHEQAAMTSEYGHLAYPQLQQQQQGQLQYQHQQQQQQHQFQPQEQLQQQNYQNYQNYQQPAAYSPTQYDVAAANQQATHQTMAAASGAGHTYYNGAAEGFPQRFNSWAAPANRGYQGWYVAQAPQCAFSIEPALPTFEASQHVTSRRLGNAAGGASGGQRKDNPRQKKQRQPPRAGQPRRFPPPVLIDSSGGKTTVKGGAKGAPSDSAAAPQSHAPAVTASTKPKAEGKKTDRPALAVVAAAPMADNAGNPACDNQETAVPSNGTDDGGQDHGAETRYHNHDAQKPPTPSDATDDTPGAECAEDETGGLTLLEHGSCVALKETAGSHKPVTARLTGVRRSGIWQRLSGRVTEDASSEADENAMEIAATDEAASATALVPPKAPSPKTLKAAHVSMRLGTPPSSPTQRSIRDRLSWSPKVAAGETPAAAALATEDSAHEVQQNSPTAVKDLPPSRDGADKIAVETICKRGGLKDPLSTQPAAKGSVTDRLMPRPESREGHDPSLLNKFKRPSADVQALSVTAALAAKDNAHEAQQNIPTATHDLPLGDGADKDVVQKIFRRWDLKEPRAKGSITGRLMPKPESREGSDTSLYNDCKRPSADLQGVANVVEPPLEPEPHTASLQPKPHTTSLQPKTTLPLEPASSADQGALSSASFRRDSEQFGRSQSLHESEDNLSDISSLATPPPHVDGDGGRGALSADGATTSVPPRHATQQTPPRLDGSQDAASDVSSPRSPGPSQHESASVPLALAPELGEGGAARTNDQCPPSVVSSDDGVSSPEEAAKGSDEAIVRGRNNTFASGGAPARARMAVGSAAGVSGDLHPPVNLIQAPIPQLTPDINTGENHQPLLDMPDTKSKALEATAGGKQDGKFCSQSSVLQTTQGTIAAAATAAKPDSTAGPSGTQLLEDMVQMPPLAAGSAFVPQSSPTRETTPPRGLTTQVEAAKGFAGAPELSGGLDEQMTQPRAIDHREMSKDEPRSQLEPGTASHSKPFVQLETNDRVSFQDGQRSSAKNEESTRDENVLTRNGNVTTCESAMEWAPAVRGERGDVDGRAPAERHSLGERDDTSGQTAESQGQRDDNGATKGDMHGNSGSYVWKSVVASAGERCQAKRQSMEQPLGDGKRVKNGSVEPQVPPVASLVAEGAHLRGAETGAVSSDARAGATQIETLVNDDSTASQATRTTQARGLEPSASATSASTLQSPRGGLAGYRFDARGTPAPRTANSNVSSYSRELARSASRSTAHVAPVVAEHQHKHGRRAAVATSPMRPGRDVCRSERTSSLHERSQRGSTDAAETSPRASRPAKRQGRSPSTDTTTSSVMDSRAKHSLMRQRSGDADAPGLVSSGVARSTSSESHTHSASGGAMSAADEQDVALKPLLSQLQRFPLCFVDPGTTLRRRLNWAAAASMITMEDLEKDYKLAPACREGRRTTAECAGVSSALMQQLRETPLHYFRDDEAAV